MTARLSDHLGRDGKLKAQPAGPAEDKKQQQGGIPTESRLLKEEPRPEEKKTKVEHLVSSMHKTDVSEEAAHKIYEQAVSTLKKSLGQTQNINKEEISQLSRNMAEELSSNGEALLSMINKGFRQGDVYINAVNVCILTIKIAAGLGYSRLGLAKLGMEALFYYLEEYQQSGEDAGADSAPGLYRELDIAGAISAAVHKYQQRIDRAADTGVAASSAGSALSQDAKIIGLAEVYEQLTHSEVHARRYNADEAMKMMVDLGSDSFKSQILEELKALVKQISPYPVGSIVKLNTGKVGMIVHVNKEFLTRPVVNVLFDSDGERLAEPQKINLAENSLLYVSSVVDIAAGLHEIQDSG